MRLRLVLCVALAGAAVLAAGCGGDSDEEAQPAATTSTTTTAAQGDAALGEMLFTSKDCVSCHTLSAVGNQSTFGPNLDALPALASKAGQPLEEFIRESIVDPGAYVEQGFPADRMPRLYAELPPAEIDALVGFLVDSTAGAAP